MNCTCLVMIIHDLSGEMGFECEGTKHNIMVGHALLVVTLQGEMKIKKVIPLN